MYEVAYNVGRVYDNIICKNSFSNFLLGILDAKPICPCDYSFKVIPPILALLNFYYITLYHDQKSCVQYLGQA